MNPDDVERTFGAALARWSLVADGPPIVTRTSRLLPARRGDDLCMLKIAVEPEERLGASLMRWWGGDGAARVLALEGDALLLERATGVRSLAALARGGARGDDEATRILCSAVARLHRPRAEPPPATLVPLPHWFRALAPAASARGGTLARAALAAKRLFATERDVVPLHGDVHHDNVLDGGAERGWLAIDPKGLLGERAFDYANIFCNPDASAALVPERFARRVDVVSSAAGVEHRRLLEWILAYAGLSAAWTFADGDDPELGMTVAGLAVSELARM